jgi:hypothetical protein
MLLFDNFPLRTNCPRERSGVPCDAPITCGRVASKEA